MPIDRTAAINYARKYWTTACDDGTFWLSNAEVSVEQKRREFMAPVSDGWTFAFEPDGKGGERAVFRRTVPDGTDTKLIQGWSGLADCAHFLSRCLKAGGIRLKAADGRIGDIVSVPKLVDSLKARTDTKTLAERVTREAAQRIIDTGVFKPGDMIGYFNVDPKGDYGGALEYSHSTMYARVPTGSDVGRVTCHTKSRFPGLSAIEDQWFLEDGSYTYTLIHFADDPPPPATLAASLQGWWKVSYAGRTEYYYIYPNGSARYVLREPRSSQELPSGTGWAYWFAYTKLGKLVYCWRKTGTVDVWSETSNAEIYSIVVNNTERGTAVKMF